jgi:hypothetical protein
MSLPVLYVCDYDSGFSVPTGPLVAVLEHIAHRRLRLCAPCVRSPLHTDPERVGRCAPLGRLALDVQ